MDFNARTIKIDDNEVKLTRTEYLLLQELVTNAGEILDDRTLLKKVWGPQYLKEREYLYVYIGHLRAKIEPDIQNPQYIIRVQQTGYVFRKAT